MRYLFQSIIAVAIAGLAIGPGVIGQESGQAGKTASPPTLPKVEYRGKDSELARLLKRRHEAAAKGYESILSLNHMGAGGLGGDGRGEMARAVQRVVTAGTELDPSAANRLRLLEFKVAYWKYSERSAKERFDHGAGSIGDFEYSVYMRCDSEIELLRARQPAAAK